MNRQFFILFQRAQQLEKRIEFLSNIPLPCNQENFEKHLLPLMTSEAISKENTMKSNKIHMLPNANEADRTPKLNTSEVTGTRTNICVKKGKHIK